MTLKDVVYWIHLTQNMLHFWGLATRHWNLGLHRDGGRFLV